MTSRALLLGKLPGHLRAVFRVAAKEHSLTSVVGKPVVGGARNVSAFGVLGGNTRFKILGGGNGQHFFHSGEK